MLSCIEFSGPDKIPVIYHPSPAGLYVHGEKLLNLFNEYPPDNATVFDTIPSPPAGTVDDKGSYHEFRMDEWDTEWDCLIFGVHGHPRKYPFESWEQAAEYQFPPLPSINREQLAEERKKHLTIDGWVSIFEKLHGLRPIDEVLMDLVSEDPALMRFLDRLVEYWLTVIQSMIDAGVDVIRFADDWGTQDAPLVSPVLFRNIFKPRYETLMAPIRKAGRKVFIHSCGFLGGILDEMVDLGISGLWPQIGLFDANPSFYAKCQEHKVTLYIHPDRQYLIPSGSATEIETAIKRYAEKYHALGGGGFFYVEIENDAPFQNVKTLVESIHRWR